MLLLVRVMALKISATEAAFGTFEEAVGLPQ